MEVVVPESSGSSLVDRRQLDKVDGRAWCDGVVRVGFDLFSESKVFLELDRKVLCSMWSAPISFIPKSRGASKAAQLVSAKKQIDFVRKEGGSIFEEPVVRLANLLKIADNSHNRNGNGSFSSHPYVGPEASILEDQVDPIRNVYQVVDTRDLSMHAVESSNLTRQGMFGEVLSESMIELFIIMSPFHERRSKVLTSHFDFRIPLVSWRTTKVSMLIERCVRGTSSQFVREWCGSSPSLRRFQNRQAGQGYLEHFQAFGASCYDGSSTRRYSRKFPAREHTYLASFRRASFSFRAPSICRLAVVRRFEWIERSIRTSGR